MTVKNKCTNCKTSLVISVQDLLFKEEKKNQPILCPICSFVVGEFETDGWIYTQTEENFNKETAISECKFPMP